MWRPQSGCKAALVKMTVSRRFDKGGSTFRPLHDIYGHVHDVYVHDVQLFGCLTTFAAEL